MNKLIIAAVLLGVMAPASVEAQDRHPPEVQVAVAALRGIQEAGVIPSDPTRLMAHQPDLEAMRPESRTSAAERHAFSRLVLLAVGVPDEDRGPTVPECEHQMVEYEGTRGELQTARFSRCEPPSGKLPLMFDVTELGAAEAIVQLRWMLVAEGDEFLLTPISYPHWVVRVVRSTDDREWVFASVIERSSAAAKAPISEN